MDFIKKQSTSFIAHFGSVWIFGIFVSAFCTALLHSTWVALLILSSFLFFFLDQSSTIWPAYPRFYLFSILSSLFVGTFVSKKLSCLVFLGSFFLIPQFVEHIQRLRGPAQNLNFLEHTDAPIFYPFRNLSEEVSLTSNSKFVFLFTTPNNSHEEWVRETMRHYGETSSLTIEGKKLLEYCSCNPDKKQILFLGHIVSDESQPLFEQCKMSLQSTCQIVESLGTLSSQGLFAYPKNL